MKHKALCLILVCVLLITVSNTPIEVSAAAEDTPIIEGITYTDGGADEIDTILLSRPLDIHVNDLLVLIVCSDNNNDGTFFNAVENFTKVGESGNAQCNSHIAVYYKVADGTEIEVNVTSAATANILGWYIRIHGVDTSDIIEEQNFAVSTEAGVNPHHIPSITTIEDNCLVLYGISLDGGDCYPTSVLSPFTELSDRVNTGEPLAAYACGSFGYQNLEDAGASEDCMVYTETTDGASYFQIAINGNIESTETTTATTGIFYDLFLSTGMWGYFGPLALVVIGFVVTKNERGLGIFFVIVDSLIIAQYLALVGTTPDYWWHIFILIFGVITCAFQMWSK